MRTFNLILILTAIFQIKSFAQGCLPNTTFFKTQEEIDNFQLNYPNCTKILGSVEIGGWNSNTNGEIKNLNGLSVLTSIEGHLYIEFTDSLSDLSGLENITTVGGNLDIGYNKKLSSLKGIDNLSFIGGYFNLESNDILIDLDELENLNEIEGSLIIANKRLESIEGLNKLDSIGGDLYLIRNRALKSLNGLNNVESVEGDLYVQQCDSLTDLTGLNKVSAVGGEFLIWSNHKLKNLEGINKLETVTKEFGIWSNPNLTVLADLNDLNYVGGRLSIWNNQSLETISGLKSDFIINWHLHLYQNASLYDCAVQSICNYLNLYPDQVIIKDNFPGCMNKEEILIQCGYGISGYSFYDFNQNQLREDFENGITANPILIEQTGDLIFPNEEGLYYYPGIEGTVYTVSPFDNSNWSITTDSLFYDILFEPGNPENSNNDFGLFPNFSSHNLTLNLTSSQTRCNEEVNFFLSVHNEGTYLENEVQLVFNYEDVIDYVTADPLPNEVDTANRALIFYVDSLYPYSKEKYIITLKMPGVDNMNDIIDAEASAFLDSLGNQIETSNIGYESEILCAYDPNDKIVNPHGVNDENYTLKGQSLNYTVRFQNTGNSYAENVTIRDTLDKNLNLSTFRVLQSSHNVNTSLSEDGIIIFDFIGIYLPDSTTNYEGSQGFVSYQIEPKVDLADSTVVRNTAYIYFDFNPPIVTNTTVNTFVEELPVTLTQKEFSENVQVFPNPSKGVFSVINDRSTGFTINIFDVFGNKIADDFLMNELTFDIEKYPRGIYILLFTDNISGKTFYRKIVKSE